ncbi:MAG: peroxiredoxin [Flaviaesturariibacter sp.]|nr:peroxiredoxin [Flaviaesturariibacter sp.]
MIQIGQQAPDFSLFDTGKNKLSLSDLRGKNVLLLFFPLAFTSVCTAELCSIRDSIKQYEAVDAQPLGISTDSLFTLAKFKEEQALNFPLLSDYNKEVSEAYGSLYETWGFDYKGVTKRSAFLVDREGIVRYAEVLENAGEQPNFNAIKAAMAELPK